VGCSHKSSALLAHLIDCTSTDGGLRFLLVFQPRNGQVERLGLPHDVAAGDCFIQVSSDRLSFILETKALEEKRSLRTNVTTYLEIYDYFLTVWPKILPKLVRECQSTLGDFIRVSKHLFAIEPESYVHESLLRQGVKIATTAKRMSQGSCNVELKLFVDKQEITLPYVAVSKLFKDRQAYQIVSDRYKELLAVSPSQ